MVFVVKISHFCESHMEIWRKKAKIGKLLPKDEEIPQMADLTTERYVNEFVFCLFAFDTMQFVFQSNVKEMGGDKKFGIETK